MKKSCFKNVIISSVFVVTGLVGNMPAANAQSVADYAAQAAILSVINNADATELNILLKDRTHYVGEIRFLGGNFVPTADGWLKCDGSLLDKTVPANQALFAEIGYKYGGSGNMFAIPKIPRYPNLLDALGISTLTCVISLKGNATH